MGNFSLSDQRGGGEGNAYQGQTCLQCYYGYQPVYNAIMGINLSTMLLWVSTCLQCYYGCRCHNCRHPLRHENDPSLLGGPDNQSDCLIFWSCSPRQCKLWQSGNHDGNKGNVWFSSCSPRQCKLWQSRPHRRSSGAIRQTGEKIIVLKFNVTMSMIHNKQRKSIRRTGEKIFVLKFNVTLFITQLVY